MWRSPCMRQHARQEGLDAVHHAPQVHAHHPLPVEVAAAPRAGRAPARRRCCTAGGRRPARRWVPLREGLDRLWLGDVRRDGERAPPARAHVGRRPSRRPATSMSATDHVHPLRQRTRAPARRRSRCRRPSRPRPGSLELHASFRIAVGSRIRDRLLVCISSRGLRHALRSPLSPASGARSEPPSA